MKYVIRFSKHVDWRRFRMLSATDKKRLQQAIEQKLTVDPVRFGKQLNQSLQGCRSLRIGAYRIIYRIKKEEVIVIVFGHRSTVYEEAKGVV